MHGWTRWRKAKWVYGLRSTSANTKGDGSVAAGSAAAGFGHRPQERAGPCNKVVDKCAAVMQPGATEEPERAVFGS
ncbi:hypothetical protein EVAR_68394_1 [Eumeta japonica]|uniref:Uncharacterized protein n=1 Tax=Eumeta variegata TaxID=151549 RepID=A0A4C2A9S7_EUMVA|nr:hypothetical protein EVAR_68394_1 [Eumeta japonica]